MKVASFKIVFIALAFYKQVALGRKASSTSEAMSNLPRCPQSKCLVIVPAAKKAQLEPWSYNTAF